MAKQKASQVWVKPSILAEELGCSVKTIAALRRKGFFKFGQHWINLCPQGMRVSPRYHLERCKQLFKRIIN